MRRDFEGLYTIDYRIVGGKPVIYLFSRDKEGNKKIERVNGYEPFFYVKSEILSSGEMAPSIVRVDSKEYKTIFNESVKKCYVLTPNQVYPARDFYKVGEGQDCYQNIMESDILFSLRYAISEINQVKETKQRILVMDIETTTEEGWSRPENPIEKITCISTHDNFTDELHTFVFRGDLKNEVVDNIHYYKSEPEMLKGFIDYWHNVSPDVVTGWNVVSFDIKYLLARLKYLNISNEKLSCIDASEVDVIEYNNDNTHNSVVRLRNKGESEIIGVVLFDALRAYRQLHFGVLRSFRLDAVAADELKGEKKDKIPNFTEVWKTDIKKLIKYNRRDVSLTCRIVNQCKLIEIFDNIKRFSGVRNISDCFYMSRVHNSNILRKYRDKYVFPTSPPYQKRAEREKLQGAYVSSSPGFYKNVAVVDYSGLYPNIIKTFNLSPEKINHRGVEINGVRILQDEEGIMPSVIDDLLKLKKDLKKQMSGTEGQTMRDKLFAIKIFINSIWGIFALSSFRMYNNKLANNVTFLGRWLIQEVDRIVKAEFGYEVIMNDTDSAAIKIPDNLDAVEEGKKIQDAVNKKLPKLISDMYKVRECSIRLELEKVLDLSLFQTKKRYAYHAIWEDGKKCDKINIVGFSSRRSDVPLIGKKVQDDLFEIILRGKEQEEAIECVKTIIDSIIENKFPIEELAHPVKLEKKVEEYKVQNTPKIRGLKWANKNLGKLFREGTKFLMIYVKHPETNVVCFDDEEDLKNANLKIDYEKTIEKCVFQKIKPIFETLKWEDGYKMLEYHAKNKLVGQQTLF